MKLFIWEGATGETNDVEQSKKREGQKRKKEKKEKEYTSTAVNEQRNQKK